MAKRQLRFRRTVPGFFLAGLCCALLHAQEQQQAPKPQSAQPAQTQPAQPDPALEAAITGLSHDDWRVREKAQQDVARFGRPAVPRIQALLGETKDPDLRARLEGVLKQIEENDTSGPTFVTLHLKDADPALAFDELARQAGAKLQTQPPALLQRPDMPRITISAERQPFWDVMRQLCAACKVRPDRSGGGTLTLAADDGSWARRPAVTSGPFLVTAAEMYVTRGVRFGAEPAAAPENPPAGNAPAPAPPDALERLRARHLAGGNDVPHDHAQLQVEALFEPKLHSMAWTVGNVVEATDDAGKSLVLTRGAEPRRRSVYGGSRSGEWEGIVWLDVPARDRPDARLARVKFLSRFSVQTGVERIEVPDVLSAKDVERVIGPARLVVRGVTKRGDRHYELSVASYPVGDVQAWRAVQVGHFRRGPRLLDANGRELMSGGGSSSMSEKEYTSQMRFTPQANGAGEPVKLVWEVPTGVNVITVPVEFENLPLP